MTGANLVWEKNTADRLADKPAERSENQVREDFSIKKIGKVVFSWWNFLGLGPVALSLLFDN